MRLPFPSVIRYFHTVQILLKAVYFTCCFCLCSAAQSQDRQAGPVVLDNADSLKSAEINGQQTRHFMGHVRIHQGDVAISCDDALQNLATNVADLQGNVIVTQDTMTIMAPRASYNAASRIATAAGGVRLTDRAVVLTAANGAYDMDAHTATFHDHVKIVNDTSVITADHLVYNRLTELSRAAGNVTIVDSTSVITCERLTNDRLRQRSYCAGSVCIRNRTDRSRIFGDTLYHDGEIHFTDVPKRPLLVRIDSAATITVDSLGGKTRRERFDTTFIASKTMTAFRGDSEIYNAYDSVRVLRRDLHACGGEAHYYRSRGVLALSRNPIAWYGDMQLTGDSITAFVRNDRLERLVSDRNAFAASHSDSLYPLRFNQLAGARLTMYFRGDSLDRVRVEKNAISVYFGFENAVPKGANRMSGDTIVITMNQGQPDKVYALGGGEGQYYPEKFVLHNEPDYRLMGFSWREIEKPIRDAFHLPSRRNN